MAEPVVSFVVNTVGNLLIQESKVLVGVSDQVEQLQMELIRMQRFLKDADKRQDEDETVRGWVSEIRELAYEAESVIETFALEIASRRENGFRKKCKRYATVFVEGTKAYKVGKEIEAIKGKITSLTASFERYGIQFKEGEGWKRKQELRRSYSHIVEEHPTVGLGEDAKILASKLLAEEHPNIVSICGMGGLGKTTLANKLYHDNDVRTHFDAFAWASISQQFQVRDVLKGILKKLSSSSSSKKEEISKMNDDEMAKELYQIQQNKKCLVILDDIWKKEDWDALKHAFPIGKLAGIIIFTTRNKALASYADPGAFVHEPKTLTQDESWELLQKKAFPIRDHPDFRITIEMEEIGREMVKKCAGLPLAIIVLGGLLATKQSFSEWNKVHENVDFYLMRGKGHDQEYSAVHGVLALSYKELPYHLKPCFLHLGHFQEDYEIPSKTLFRLWVAEGFVPQIQHKGEAKESMEDVAECYLGELIDRSMVQVGKRGSTGRVKTCRLHDMMRDLCQSKANDEKFLEIIRAHNIHEKPISDRAHRFVVYADDEDLDFRSYAKTPYLRSLLFFGRARILSTLRYFKLLKVLSLVKCKIVKEMGKELGCLIHLRYLAFENCDIDCLPPSIGNLRYLQTFIVRNEIDHAFVIPNVLCNFEQLRHLKLVKCEGEGGKLLKLGNMRSLQTLGGFDTSTFDVADLMNFSELKKLDITLDDEEKMKLIPSVCLNRLTCLYIITMNKKSKDMEAELKRVFSDGKHLQKLCLKGKTSKKLPEYEHFLPYLTNVTLYFTYLEEDPMGTLEKLPNLGSLCLLGNSFMGKLLVCSSKGFPQLKTLVLENLPNLEDWRVDEEAMSSLCHLRISLCYKLKMVPDGFKFITTLRQLEIAIMPKLFKERLQVVEGKEGEDLYKVRHVPSIIFENNYDLKLVRYSLQDFERVRQLRMAVPKMNN